MAEDIKKTSEVKAYARGIHMSPRKVRLVASLLKNMPVEEALNNLTFMTKKAALPIRKLVDSGVANAKHNFQIDLDRLFVKSVTVDGGQVMKRFRPRAQGRAFPIRRRTSHINLVLGVAEKAFKAKRKLVQKKTVEPQAKGEILAAGVEDQKKSRFGFRRKTGQHSQLPGKMDPQGKYTSFDRRSGE